MESLQNTALQEARETQRASMTVDLDKINNSPELQAFYDDIESKPGATLGEIFTRDLNGLGDYEEEEQIIQPEDSKKSEPEEEEVAEDEHDEGEQEGDEEEVIEAESEDASDAKSKKEKAKYVIKRESYERLQKIQEQEVRLQEAERRNQELIDQMERLKLSEQQSWETAAIQYEHNLKNHLARGQAMLKLAIENYDEEAKFEAFEIIQEAKSNLRALTTPQLPPKEQSYPPQAYQANSYNTETQGYTQQYNTNNTPQYNPTSQTQANDPNLVAQELINSWVRKHDIINENSIYFKPQVREKLVSYANKYETDLRNQGKGHLINSEGYFNKLDGYVEALRESPIAETTPSKKPSTSHIGSVKGAGAMGASRPKVDLTAEELSIINDLPGDTEKIKAEWLKNKMNSKNASIGLAGSKIR